MEFPVMTVTQINEIEYSVEIRLPGQSALVGWYNSFHVA